MLITSRFLTFFLSTFRKYGRAKRDKERAKLTLQGLARDFLGKCLVDSLPTTASSPTSTARLPVVVKLSNNLKAIF